MSATENLQEMTDEVIILSQLVLNKEFRKKILHQLDLNWFTNSAEKRFVRYLQGVDDDTICYATVKNASDNSHRTEEEKVHYNLIFNEINRGDVLPTDHLLKRSNTVFKQMAVTSALYKAISAIEGDGDVTIEQLPELFKESVSISFESKTPMNYFSKESYEARYEMYQSREAKIPFKLKTYNIITNDGVERKALHTFVASPNVGKSSWLISLGADYVELGYNVLYVTCEMSERQIGIRFDSRFMQEETNDIPNLSKDEYMGAMENLASKIKGQLLVKEYPTNELTSAKLESLVDDIKAEHGYVPDVVIVDYIGICSSYHKIDRNNLGIYYTKVAEEFRATAMKMNFALWTAQQMTTDALDATDPTLKHIGYGQGIAKTSDMIWFGIRTEETDERQELMIKQVKTRYHKERTRRFNIGFDISYMTMKDSDNSGLEEEIAEKEKSISHSKLSTLFANGRLKSPVHKTKKESVNDKPKTAQEMLGVTAKPTPTFTDEEISNINDNDEKNIIENTSVSELETVQNLDEINTNNDTNNVENEILEESLDEINIIVNTAFNKDFEKVKPIEKSDRQLHDEVMERCIRFSQATRTNIIGKEVPKYKSVFGKDPLDVMRIKFPEEYEKFYGNKNNVVPKEIDNDPSNVPILDDDIDLPPIINVDDDIQEPLDDDYD